MSLGLFKTHPLSDYESYNITTRSSVSHKKLKVEVTTLNIRTSNLAAHNVHPPSLVHMNHFIIKYCSCLSKRDYKCLHA